MIKRVFVFSLFLCASLNSRQASAQIPVIDSSNLAQAISQVQAWGQQYQQMIQQFQQLQQTYQSIQGVRGMGSLVNNPAQRNYLPANYQDILQGAGSTMSSINNLVSSLQQAAQIVGVQNTSLDPNSTAGQLFSAIQNLNAMNAGLGQTIFSNESNNFTNIQALLDEVNNAPDQKDILDLTARIQAEQVMAQNEANKLQALIFLAKTQSDTANQQAKEIAIDALSGQMPDGW
jgi:type IV secretion system protein VirB5